MLGAQAEPYYDGMDERYDSYEPTYLPNNEDYENEYTPDEDGKSYYNEEPYSYGDSYSDDMYSEYPRKDNKFECEEGPFTGFFVSDPIFCDVELPAGPQGPQGLPGPPGPRGQTGPAGSGGSAFDATTDFKSQCLKCADLAVIQASNIALLEEPNDQDTGPTFPQREASIDLTRPSPNNVFTVCQAETDTEQIEDFNTLVDIRADFEESRIETGFRDCVTNAPTPPTPPTTALQPQSLESSLQENSLTTNVKPEIEIPIFSDQTSPSLFSPPTVAQGAEGAENSSSALANIEKLKKQWLELLP